MQKALIWKVMLARLLVGARHHQPTNKKFERTSTALSFASAGVTNIN